jgi:hypothetical protein
MLYIIIKFVEQLKKNIFQIIKFNVYYIKKILENNKDLVLFYG